MTDNTKDKSKETIPFFPDHLMTEVRVVWILLGLAVVVGILAVFFPVGLEEPADPMITPDHTKPEWYFLALYELLKYVPKTTGVLIPIIGVLLIFVWPFIDRKPNTPKQTRIRWIFSIVFMVVLIAGTIIGFMS